MTSTTSGRPIASRSYDEAIKIRDAQTGVCEQTPDVGEGGRRSNIGHVDTSEKLRMHVLINRGWIVVHIGKGLDKDATDIQSQHSTEAMGDTHSHGLGYGLSMCGQWIRRHDQNVIWLSPDYQSPVTASWTGRTTSSPTFSQSVSRVATGLWTGQVVMLGPPEPGPY